MILKKTIVPQSLLWAISSGWETECFCSQLTLKPGTGAELWLSTKPFHVQNGNLSTYSNMQLLTPREGSYVITPNHEKIVVLRIRHNRIFMLSREQTNAIMDAPVDLHALWGKPLMQYLPHYFELGSEVSDGLSLLLQKLLIETNDLKNDLVEFLYKHPTMKVAEVALEFNYTPRHIQKKFMEAHGVSIKQYQLICRIEKAIKDTILNGDVHEAILNCGFYDQSHFIKSFKNIHLMTPTDFLSDPVNNYFYNRKSPPTLSLS